MVTTQSFTENPQRNTENQLEDALNAICNAPPTEKHGFTSVYLRASSVNLCGLSS
jgi:hypothetical protein